MATEITRRSCANCAAFNASPKADDPLCWNLIPITADEASTGRCDQHLTADEDRLETASIEQGRRSGGFPGALAAMATRNQGRKQLQHLRLIK